MSRFKNLVLQSLNADSIDRLQLQPVKLERRHTIEVPGEEIRHLFFIEDGIGSMTAQFQDGSQTEIGLFGWESIIGVSSLIGTRLSLNNIYMQLPGHGFTTTRALAEAEFRRFGTFHDLALRFLQTQLLQASQSAGCNARHNLQQRLARWLLLCNDRTRSNEIDLTQEFLAQMLGVERSTVSIVAGKLQEQGLIEYHRGKVMLLNRAGLEAISCECYHVLHDYLASYAVNSGDSRLASKGSAHF